MKRILLLLFVLSLAAAASAQRSLADEEARLVRLYSRLGPHTPYDSVGTWSDAFATALTALLRSNDATLDHPFQRLQDSNYCWIRTSADGRFRIYSWDTWQGGTMTIARSVYQWRSGNRVYTKEAHFEGEAGRMVAALFTIKAPRRTYYLPVWQATYSSKDVLHTVAAFAIEGARLTDTARLFWAGKRRYRSIDVAFDFFSVVDRPERPLQLITWHPERQVLLLPVVDLRQQVTRRRLRYSWQGAHFEYSGTE